MNGIRLAGLKDLTPLLVLENRCFEGDRMTRRRFEHFLRKGHGRLYVLDGPQGLLAYAMLLYHRGTSLARLYSLAVAPEAQGQGLARALMEFSETEAGQDGKLFMRLEVRVDNRRAIGLYERMGYRAFGTYEGYYEDGCNALRMEKSIHRHSRMPDDLAMHYAQTTEFTCGPASLMMAMHQLEPAFPLNQRVELQLWREATTIFMTSGHGGCSPHGLALAAWRRGFAVQLFVNQTLPLFVEGVRHPDKKAVLMEVHRDFVEQLLGTDVEVSLDWPGLGGLRQALAEGASAIVLISTWRFTRNKSPHWVMICGMDDQHIYINDPEVDEPELQSTTDNVHVPIPLADFERATRFGTRRLRSALLLRRRPSEHP